MKQPISSLLCLIMFLVVSSTDSAAETTKNIFVLAGQSNMVGQGGIVEGKWDGVIPPECQSNQSIFRLNDQLSWEEAREPLHQGINQSNVPSWGIGPGMPFANSVLARNSGSNGVIGLVPIASAGTTITQWKHGGPLYNQLVDRARAAVSNGGGVIRAILWYQGENDTLNPEDADLYKKRLEKFFGDLRADLQSPRLPIIQVALASGNPLYMEIVRKAQFQVETELPNVKCVDAKGLQLGPDGVHLSTAGQVQLGTMMADAFLAAFI